MIVEDEDLDLLHLHTAPSPLPNMYIEASLRFAQTPYDPFFKRKWAIR
jgi:hypothetical protein